MEGEGLEEEAVVVGGVELIFFDLFVRPLPFTFAQYKDNMFPPPPPTSPPSLSCSVFSLVSLLLLFSLLLLSLLSELLFLVLCLLLRIKKLSSIGDSGLVGEVVEEGKKREGETERMGAAT